MLYIHIQRNAILHYGYICMILVNEKKLYIYKFMLMAIELAFLPGVYILIEFLQFETESHCIVSLTTYSKDENACFTYRD